jgi:hypothetical protein
MPGRAKQYLSDKNRRELRQRAYLGAKLVYGDGAFTLDCVVRDITLNGARVRLPEGQAVPDKVFLVELRSGIAYEAQVTWKRHPEIGLKFVHQHGLSEASGPHLMILKRLWLEHCERPGV